MKRASFHVTKVKTWGMAEVKWEQGTAKVHGNGALAGSTCSLGLYVSEMPHNGAKE
jgi:hypothetical protein